MRFSGSLVQWNDERGFGWIEADDGAGRVFVHISAFTPRPAADQRPQNGQRLEFSVEVQDGKKRAQQVAWKISAQAAGRSGRKAGQSPGWRISSKFSYGALLVWLVLMAGLAMQWGVPSKVFMVYGALSFITFVFYWRDKAAAQQGAWRTAESTLQMLAMLGGWPGAVLAQQWMRHKTSKTSFQVTFWMMVSINVLGVIWLCSPSGRPLLQSWGVY